jgi:DNA-binding transcriptional regulator GbsR (MarR family)
MSKASNSQQIIASQFELRPILYIPGLAHLFGMNEAILLGQLLYWDGKGHSKHWTYKTIEELHKETGLKRSKQDSAIRHLKELGVLEVQYHRVPNVRHFRVDVDVLQEIIISMLETSKLNYLKPATKSADFKQTITETTQVITTKNTSTGSMKEPAGEIDFFENYFNPNYKPIEYDYEIEENNQ